MVYAKQKKRTKPSLWYLGSQGFPKWGIWSGLCCFLWCPSRKSLPSLRGNVYGLNYKSNINLLYRLNNIPQFYKYFPTAIDISMLSASQNIQNDSNSMSFQKWKEKKVKTEVQVLGFIDKTNAKKNMFLFQYVMGKLKYEFCWLRLFISGSWVLVPFWVPFYW